MENTDTPGYITEKIILAYLGGCVPIYWGTREIFHVFHTDSFILYDVDHPDEALKELQQLVRTGDDAWKRKRMAPILAHHGEHGEEDTLETFFSFHESIGSGRLKQAIRNMTGFNDEHA